MSITQQPFFAAYEWYRTMRTNQPVFYDEQHQTWHVFRYAEVQRVLNGHATFSSDIRAAFDLPEEGGKLAHASLIFMDPPRHRQLRNLASLAFTPRMVAQMETRIQAITHELLDQAPADLDIIRDLATPLPVIIIADLLGIPAEKRADFKRWSDSAMATAGPPSMLQQDQARQTHLRNQEEMNDYFVQIMDERRASPRDDLISALMAAEVEGERLSSRDVLAFCTLLLVAGNETTTNLVGNSAICFDQHPEALEQIRHNPELLPGAIEEVLRYASPVKMMVRFTKSEVMLGDQLIGPKQSIMAWLSSANRDAAQFPEPDHFDIQRSPNRHIAFGHGIHFCLGAPLARLESKIALTALLARCPGRWHLPENLEPIDGLMLFGAKNLPITWEN